MAIGPLGEGLLVAEVLADLRRGRLAPLEAAGDRKAGRGVVHARYGVGTVISAEPSAGVSSLATVDFQHGAVTVPVQELHLTIVATD